MKISFFWPLVCSCRTSPTPPRDWCARDSTRMEMPLHLFWWPHSNLGGREFLFIDAALQVSSTPRLHLYPIKDLVVTIIVSVLKLCAQSCLPEASSTGNLFLSFPSGKRYCPWLKAPNLSRMCQRWCIPLYPTFNSPSPLWFTDHRQQSAGEGEEGQITLWHLPRKRTEAPPINGTKVWPWWPIKSAVSTGGPPL